MKEVGKRADLVSKTLLGRGYPHTEIQAYTKLAQLQNNALGNEDLWELLQLCKHADYETVWRIIFGVSAYDFENSLKWLELVAKPFDQNFPNSENEDEKSFFGGISTCSATDYVCGAILGIFKTISVLNEDATFSLVGRIITGNNNVINAATDYTNEDPSKFDKLKGTLSNEIHAFIKNDKKETRDWFIKWRAKYARRIFNEVKKNKKENFSKVGSFVLEQICHASFGMFKADDKMNALELFFTAKNW